MKQRARVRSRPGVHRVIVESDGRSRSVPIPPKDEGPGSSVSGGELLLLSLATCYCNDVYREASRRGLRIDEVAVEVEGDFGGPGDPARDIRLRVEARSPHAREEVEDLLRATDLVAEIHNTLRQSTPVVLEEARSIPSEPESAAGAPSGPLGNLVGKTARRSLLLTAESVARYAEITGDRNPLHFDPAFAAATKFGKLVVHGGLTAGILNALVAEDLPGPGTVFMSQELTYRAPVFVGDTITGEVEVLSMHTTKPVSHIRATVRRGDGEVVLEGTCWCYTFRPTSG